MLYAFQTVFTKLASGCEFLSLGYIGYVACAVAVLGLYAVIWQQIIKRVPISDAYMFKGSVLIFVLIISAAVFGEHITVNNMIGAALIVGGIVLNSRL